jgi:hypothetical protein
MMVPPLRNAGRLIPACVIIGERINFLAGGPA